ncbi:MAG: carboxypeptidase regulatory-like domain-containing protein [Bryobacteraceae bacterium]
MRVALVALLAAPLVRAQSTLGTMVGVVKDQSGAVTPGVVVTVRHEEQGQTREASTNARGEYEITQLPEGTYTVQAEAAGFRGYVNRGVRLSVRQVLRIDIQLQIGEISERVTVSGAAPVVNSESATISGGMQESLLREFHTPTANAYSPHLLAMMMLPGSVHLGNAQFKLGGARGNMYESKVDGSETNHNEGSPSVLSVKEMNIVYVNANAEYRSPATVDAVMQSGTNTFRGGARAELENGALNAAGVGAQRRPPGVPFYYGEYFGGGPVMIPKIYNGKDRTHFYVDYERGKNGSYFRSGFLDVPPAQFRQGDFSALSRQLVNPFTGAAFTGNSIPQSLMNPGSLWLQDKYWPLPNAGAAGALALNYAATNSASWFVQRWYFRGDHQISRMNHVSFGYTRFTEANIKGTGVWTGGLVAKVPDGGANIYTRFNQNYILTDTHTFSPTRLNEFRLSLQYYQLPGQYSVRGKTILDGAGIKGVALDLTGTPRIDINGFSGMWGGAGGGQYTGEDTVNKRYQLIDNFTLIQGHHSFKFGTDLRRIDAQSWTGGVWAGSYNFDGRFTGFSWADFLLGLPSTTSRFTPRPPVSRYNWLYAFYLQDDFKVSPRFTLQYGLRYDNSTVPVDKAGAFFNFDPATGNIVVPDDRALGLVSPAFPSTIKIVTASQAGFPKHLLKGNNGRLSPRVGISFRPFSNANTVLRAGFGHFSIYSYGLNTGGPFALTENFINQMSNGAPLLTLSNPFPRIGAPPAQSSTGINPNLRDAAFTQWNLSVERDIGFSTALRLSYIGSKSSFLQYSREINRPPASTIPFAASRNPYPLFQSVSYTDNGGNATYHGFQMQATRRFTRGLSIDAALTYHKELTDSHNEGSYFDMGLNDPYNRASNKGPATALPMPYEVSLNYLYQLPFGRGRQYLSQVPAIVSHVLGGWDASGYFAAYSGRWWTATYSGRDISNMNIFSGRPDRTCNGNLPSGQRTEGRWFDNSCFVVPPAGVGRFGNAGINSIQGPGAWFYNMGVYKHFPVYERLNFRVGMTAINLLNHPVWDQPRTNISASNVGTLGMQPSLMNFPNLRTIKLNLMLEF